MAIVVDSNSLTTTVYLNRKIYHFANLGISWIDQLLLFGGNENCESVSVSHIKIWKKVLTENEMLQEMNLEYLCI